MSTPIEELVPKIVKALLSERNFSGKLVWSQDQCWLASLVVALVEERAWRKASSNGMPRYDIALRDVNISPSDYEEIKRRVEG